MNEIIERARETLRRLEAADRQRALEKWQRGPVEEQAGDHEDALLAWERLRLQSVEPQKPEPQKPQPRSAPTMDAETQKGWDRWVRAHIQRESEVLIDATVEYVVSREKLLRDEIAKLAEEVGQLRAELAVLRSIDRADVIDLPAWRKAS